MAEKNPQVGVCTRTRIILSTVWHTAYIALFPAWLPSRERNKIGDPGGGGGGEERKIGRAMSRKARAFISNSEPYSIKASG
jgi:hypothetical protein